MNKSERFLVAQMFICPFVIRDDKGIVPDLNYPLRFCVIDKERKIVVDIKNKLKYDYVETISMLYFINDSLKKIRNNKRVGVFPVLPIPIDLEINELSNDIITKLENSEDFKEGNEVLSNEEYLKSIENENLELVEKKNNESSIKWKIKRQKK